jgi:high-affinity Fe2+/Pb2+ permease
VGNILHTLVGYSAQPTALQFAAYLLTLGAITLLLRSYGGAAPLRSGGH